MYTTEKGLSSKKFPQFCYSILAGLSGVVIGTAIGWNSPVTNLMMKGNGDGKDSSVDARRLITWNTAGCYCLGTTIGSLVQGMIADLFGFKPAIVMCDLIVLVGWLILLQVDNTPVASNAIWVGRLVQGIGSGGLSLLTPMYISQIIDFDIRGRMNIFHHSFVCFGIFYSYAFGTIIDYAKLTGVCMMWPVLHLFIAFFLPESPFHLYKCNDSDMVKNTMCQIKGKNYDVDSDYDDLREYMQRNVTECSSSAEMDDSREKRQVRTLIIGLGLVVFQQTCGVNSLIFYIEQIFNEIGLFDNETAVVSSRIVLVVVSMMQIILCLATVELVEFWGRKCMLIASALGMTLGLSALMFYYIYSAKSCADENEEQNNISVYFIILYMCSYSIGWGPVVMLVYTETIYFDKWFSSLIYAGGQFVMFLLVYTFFTANTLMDNTYKLWMYIASCIVSIVFVCYCVPETRAQNLNRVQSMLDNRNGRDDKCS